jgi:DNA polymerase-3 subunit delta
VEDIGVYFEGIQPTTVLVVCYKTNNDPTKTGKNIDKRSTFYKNAKKIGVAFESNPIPDYKIARWIDSFVAEQGLSIAPDAASLLAESAGTDLQKLALAVEKLRKILPENRTRINIQDVEENVGMSRDYSAFELTKALSLRDAAKVFRIVGFFADSPKRFPIQMTLAALSSHFLRLLRYHAMLQDGVSRNDILAQLGINPYFGGEYDTAVRNYPVKKVMRIIALLKDYDQRSKSNTRGEASDGDLLKELTAKILA